MSRDGGGVDVVFSERPQEILEGGGGSLGEKETVCWYHIEIASVCVR